MVFDNNRIYGSEAVTSTIGGVLLAPNPTCQMHEHARVNFEFCSGLGASVLNAGTSAGSNVRHAQRLLRSLFYF